MLYLPWCCKVSDVSCCFDREQFESTGKMKLWNKWNSRQAKRRGAMIFFFAVWREPKRTVHLLRRRSMEQGTSPIANERSFVFSGSISTARTFSAPLVENVDSPYFWTWWGQTTYAQKRQCNDWLPGGSVWPTQTRSHFWSYSKSDEIFFHDLPVRCHVALMALMNEWWLLRASVSYGLV